MHSECGKVFQNHIDKERPARKQLPISVSDTFGPIDIFLETVRKVLKAHQGGRF